MQCKKKWAKCYFKTYGDFGTCYAVRKQLIKKFLGKYIWLNILYNEYAAARGGQNTIIYEMGKVFLVWVEQQGLQMIINRCMILSSHKIIKYKVLIQKVNAEY